VDFDDVLLINKVKTTVILTTIKHR